MAGPDRVPLRVFRSAPPSPVATTMDRAYAIGSVVVLERVRGGTIQKTEVRTADLVLAKIGFFASAAASRT